MLQEIRSDLVIQQQDDDAKHVRDEQECADAITEFDRRINVAQQVIADAQAAIAMLENEIDQLQKEIANKQIQLEILTRRESDLRAARERDAIAFDKR